MEVGASIGFIIMLLFETEEEAERYADKNCFRPEITKVETKHYTRFKVIDLYDNQNLERQTH